MNRNEYSSSDELRKDMHKENREEEAMRQSALDIYEVPMEKGRDKKPIALFCVLLIISLLLLLILIIVSFVKLSKVTEDVKILHSKYSDSISNVSKVTEDMKMLHSEYSDSIRNVSLELTEVKQTDLSRINKMFAELQETLVSKVTEDMKMLHSEYSDSIRNVSLELTEVKQTDLSRINKMFAELQETLVSKVTEDMKMLHSEYSDSIRNVSLELTEVKQTDLSRINKMFAELQETLVSKVTEDMKMLHSEYSDSIRNVSLELTEVKQTDLSRINKMFAELQETLGSICNACPYGWKWFNGSCYSFSEANKNWEGARISCNDRDSHLVIINNKDEQSFLSTNIGSENYWIGLNDKDKEGDWRWVDRSPLSFTFWLNGEPNNHNEEDCAHLVYNAATKAQWNDINCDNTFRWICEKRTLCNFGVPGSSG
ncbi:CD209 antigen-like protein B isoform X5 [Microcaecilia unicolor]|uniref:CD209 antigen-like protein B isoform X5 n=1 Tax=Microcaecilia unicolor TaxID=1415580 RepID=A0A6P7XLH2_9AMPH|nr:CD209 antigen-like protein B isoform X5 [Microcaecilia unicolor]